MTLRMRLHDRKRTIDEFAKRRQSVSMDVGCSLHNSFNFLTLLLAVAAAVAAAAVAAAVAAHQPHCRLSCLLYATACCLLFLLPLPLTEV